jgi:light-harvesting complex II chlorophyll a/b binding protein 7
MPLVLLRSAAPPRAIPRRQRRNPLLVRASWQELASVLVFSAVPFTAVKTLANSPLGARLRRRLEDRKAAAAAEAEALRAAAREARDKR